MRADEHRIPFEIKAQLLPCVGCVAPYIIIDGVPQGVLVGMLNAGIHLRKDEDG